MRKLDRPRLGLERICHAALCCALLGLLLQPGSGQAEPAHTLDLAILGTDGEGLRRVHGSDGLGSLGVPVAGGFDCNDDGFPDYAFSAMVADPDGRTDAGEVYLIFGDGTLDGSLETALADPDILHIWGEGLSENTGTEVWMADVTDDGIGDLLISRQNYTLPGQGGDPDRVGAGALTILVGDPSLSDRSGGLLDLDPLDLGNPPAGVTLATFVGGEAFGRFGMWVRAGDITGDGIADFVVGADQEGAGIGTHRGAVYVIRGGAHLAANQVVDLADFGSTALAGHIARIDPPASADHFHLGATVQVADLDGNGRSEVLAAAALARSGGTLQPLGGGPADGNGGTQDGTLYIAWDDNFPAGPWTAGLNFAIDSSPASRTIIDGAAANRSFGEEILGGRDYDNDGNADLFVGDILGNITGDRPNAGSGHVFYHASQLKGLEFDLEAPPPGLAITNIAGPTIADIAADTAADGDFDGDGIDDLMVTSPKAAALGRLNAGIVHVFFGRNEPWPAFIDLGNLPPPGAFRISEVYGREVNEVLGYSAAAGDLDGDGTTDLIVNEMLGDAPTANDVGNLIALSGAALTPPDADADGVPDTGDSCIAVANGPLAGANDQTDADDDGFGDLCDCDFDQSGDCTLADFAVFLPDLLLGVDSGTGTDMNTDGTVNIGDFLFFLPGLLGGAPGPSAWAP